MFIRFLPLLDVCLVLFLLFGSATSDGRLYFGLCVLTAGGALGSQKHSSFASSDFGPEASNDQTKQILCSSQGNF